MRREIAHLTSDNMASILNSTSSDILNEFTWDCLLAEVKSAAPTLLELLQGCTKTKKPRKNQNAIIGVLIAMCKHRRPTSSLIQRLFSLILYSRHASMVVYYSFQFRNSDTCEERLDGLLPVAKDYKEV